MPYFKALGLFNAVCGSQETTPRNGMMAQQVDRTMLSVHCPIHLILHGKMGMAICKFYGFCFRSHLLPAIFSCTKMMVLLLDIANWCVLPYYFSVLS